MKKHSGKTSIPVGLTAAMLASSLVGGCTLGPDYERPPISVPTTFRAQLTPTEAASFADLPWWSAFNDPTLQSLISEAVVNNYEVQIAVARIEQARAALGMVSSESVPQLNYGAGVGGGRGLVQSQDSVSAVTAGTITGGLNAAWEIDLWGRIRRSTEAARANLLAQEDVRQGVMLSLVTDVANGYSRLLELDRELAIANESTRAFKGSFDLFTARFAAGRDSKLSVHRSQANYDESRARAADLKRQIAQQENALSILLGSYPKSIPRGRGLAEQTLPATPLGASSDLLQRRPDILAAEENMIAANAERRGDRQLLPTHRAVGVRRRRRAQDRGHEQRLRPLERRAGRHRTDLQRRSSEVGIRGSPGVLGRERCSISQDGADRLPGDVGRFGGAAEPCRSPRGFGSPGDGFEELRRPRAPPL
jgi:outer membrane protein, multidrug efflux system